MGASQQVLHTFPPDAMSVSPSTKLVLGFNLTFNSHPGRFHLRISGEKFIRFKGPKTSGFCIEKNRTSGLGKKNPLRRKTSHMGKANLGEKIWWQSILPDGNERKKWGEVLELQSWKLGFCLETVEKMTQTHSLKLTYTPENGWLEDYFSFLGRPIFKCYVSLRECIPLKWWF